MNRDSGSDGEQRGRGDNGGKRSYGGRDGGYSSRGRDERDRPFRSGDDRRSYQGRGRGEGGRPFRDRDGYQDRDRRSSSDRGEGRPPRDRDERRPYRDRDDRGPRQERGYGGERRSFRDRDDRGPRGEGERRPFRDRDDWRPRGEGERRPYRDRDDRGSQRDSYRGRDSRDRGEGRPFRDRDDRGSYRDRGERRPYQDRGEGRSYRDRDDRGSYRDRGEGRPYRDRDDRGSSRDRGERRPYQDRGEGRPYQERGERRPYRDREEGRPPRDRGERGPHRDREERRPYRDRDDRGPRRDDRGPRREGGPRPFSREDRPGTRARFGRQDREDAPRRERLPEVAPDISAEDLDKEVRDELRSLPGDLAELVGRHLLAAERALEEDDPDKAYEHTQVARRFAARVGVVREAAGIVAYRAGHYSEALSDLRAARRITGSDEYLPIMADCERGMGRPERALDLVRSREAERLDRAGRIELTIVESGARRDLGQHDAAVITLQRLPELRDPQARPWSARLAFAYADALEEAGQREAALDWFGRAMAFDEDGETDAAERYAQLSGGLIEDVEEYFDEDFVSPENATEPTEAEPVTDDADSAESPSTEDTGPSTPPTTTDAVPDEAEAPSAGEIGSGASPSTEETGQAGTPGAGDTGHTASPSKGETQPITPSFIEPDFGDQPGEGSDKRDEDSGKKPE